MNDSISHTNDSQYKAIKQIWRFGNKHLVIIDASIMKKLAINDDITFVEQELINENEILMRIRRINI
jgi:antitoxin component of MazEF toxin-antitoxin module